MERPTQEASENFLFHLYRGTELLGDNRIQEAKEEIERAHALQPQDFNVRDLLAALYFRLGSFDRALAIYQALVQDVPEQANLHLNLGLARFRMGDIEEARRSFERALDLDPSNRRTYGYLGVALERLGHADEARVAFERGGQEALARRLSVNGDENQLEAQAIDSRTAGLELPEPFETKTPIRTEDSARTLAPRASREDNHFDPPTLIGTHSVPSLPSGALTLGTLSSNHGDLPMTRGFTLTLSETPVKMQYAVRAESVRAIAGTVHTTSLDRKYRTSSNVELLGGAFARMLQMEGEGELVLAARHAHSLVHIELAEESMFMREEALVAFDFSFPYVSGKLARGEEEPVYLVQLKGSGDVLLEVRGGLRAFSVTEQRSIFVQADDLLGWTDRLVPQLVEPADAPGGKRGLVSFAGTGTVFIVRHDA